jgi:hypothetical protein
VSSGFLICRHSLLMDSSASASGGSRKDDLDEMMKKLGLRERGPS